MSVWCMTAPYLLYCKHMHERSWLTYHEAAPQVESLIPAECCFPIFQVEASALLQQLLPVKERVAAADAALLRVDPARSVTKAFRVRTGGSRGRALSVILMRLQNRTTTKFARVDTSVSGCCMSAWPLANTVMHVK
jgi:hypothetical protein